MCMNYDVQRVFRKFLWKTGLCFTYCSIVISQLVPDVVHNFFYTVFISDQQAYLFVAMYHRRVIFFSECMSDMLQA